MDAAPSGPSPLAPPLEAQPAARRRPGLVALYFAYVAIAGLVIALPSAALLGHATSNYPDGDAELFAPGGVMLLEALRLARRAVVPVAASTGTAGLLAALAGLLPLAALVAGLGRRGRLDARFLTGAAFCPLGTLALAWGAFAFLQTLAALLETLLGGGLVNALHPSPRGDWIGRSVVLAAIGLAVVAVGVVRDLVSVAAVHGDRRFVAAISAALTALRRAPGRTAWAYAWRASLGLTAVAAAALLAPPLMGSTPASVALAALLHQAGIAAAVIARASWLAAAIGILSHVAPTPEAVSDALDHPGGTPGSPADAPGFLEAPGEPAGDAPDHPGGTPEPPADAPGPSEGTGEPAGDTPGHSGGTPESPADDPGRSGGAREPPT
jgi:hypothetical protein